MSAFWFLGMFAVWAVLLVGMARLRRREIRRQQARRTSGTLWPGSNANHWPPPSPCSPAEWPCNPEDGWICPAHVAEGIGLAESWANHG